MLDQLDAQSPDALLALIKMHAQDPREDKIDLGVGVYRTNDGATPVFRAIKAAEQKLVDTQDSKSYLGPEGDTGFVDALKPYIFGKDAAMGGRLEGMQTPGGTGAVRLAVALSKAAGVQRVYLGTPSWPNHAQILEDFAQLQFVQRAGVVVIERVEGIVHVPAHVRHQVKLRHFVQRLFIHHNAPQPSAPVGRVAEALGALALTWRSRRLCGLLAAFCHVDARG